MDDKSSDMASIHGACLTAWDVLPGGSRIGLDFTTSNRQPHRVVLPFDALSGLLMTLPNILQTALDARFAGSNVRVVQ